MTILPPEENLRQLAQQTPLRLKPGKFERSPVYAMTHVAANFQEKKLDPPVISVTIGAPTYPANEAALKKQIKYCEELLKSKGTEHYEDELGVKELRNTAVIALKQIIETSAKVAKHLGKASSTMHMPKWSGWNESNLAFVPGGMAGAHFWIASLTERMIKKYGKEYEGLIVYPSPNFGSHELVVDYASHNHLSVIGPDMLKTEPKLVLTPDMMEESIKQGIAQKSADIEKAFVKKRITQEVRDERLANLKQHPVAGFFFCDPNNPTGRTMGYEGWKAILPMLQKKEYSDVPIFVDEAHCGTKYDGGFVSILAACPQIADRVVVCRSITKEQGLTATRMAAVFGGDKKIISGMQTPIMNTFITSPHGGQEAMAAGLQNIAEEGTSGVANYYGRSVLMLHRAFMEAGCQNPNSAMPESTFCYMADLRELFDLPIPDEYKRILPQAFKSNTVTNDREAAFYLALRANVFATPVSGVSQSTDKKYGLVRIVVDGDLEKTKQISERVIAVVEEARAYKHAQGIPCVTENRKAGPDELAKIDAEIKLATDRYERHENEQHKKAHRPRIGYVNSTELRQIPIGNPSRN